MNKYGYVRVSAISSPVELGDVKANVETLKTIIKKASENNVDFLVLPELCITGYTCGDLFLQTLLIEKSEEGIKELLEYSKDYPVLFAVGCPVVHNSQRFNCAVVLAEGNMLGIVPKTHIPNYGEFYEKRWFDSGASIKSEVIQFAGKSVGFGTDLLFKYKGVIVGVEICEDLWVPEPPSGKMSVAGADIILNLSASDELIGKKEYIQHLVSQQSARCRSVYAYASCGKGESTTDLVFSGYIAIGDNGALSDIPSDDFISPLQSQKDDIPYLIKDIDIEKNRLERCRFSTFSDNVRNSNDYRVINCETKEKTKEIFFQGQINKTPFVPDDHDSLSSHCNEIIDIQTRALMRRLDASYAKSAVIGVSGGLDSTLALLVTVNAFDRSGRDRKGIIGITMPGKATSSRTKSNATLLMEYLGITILTIPIEKAVEVHFKDIGHDPKKYDIVYENSQARERTQILMDLSNKYEGIVIGTGDMSELALGWCTYNGDQMSMYGVNSGVPKTLVKHLVGWFSHIFDKSLSEILEDIIDTPISPELIPSNDGEISQKTEEFVGPYELTDFFLFYYLRYSFSPSKIFWLATRAFNQTYDDNTILKWMRTFYKRFFSQQFKRSCMPDGPKVGSVSLSPRGDWRMPSDAKVTMWLKELDEIENEINGKVC